MMSSQRITKRRNSIGVREEVAYVRQCLVDAEPRSLAPVERGEGGRAALGLNAINERGARGNSWWRSAIIGARSSKIPGQLVVDTGPIEAPAS